MANAFPGTKTSSDVDYGANTLATPDRTINLGQHSLNAVIGHNKSLWRLPRRWTQAHLDVLCVDRQTDASTDKDNLDRNRDGLSPHALVPWLTSLEDHVESIAKGAQPERRAEFLDKMLILRDIDTSYYTTKAIRFLGGSGYGAGFAIGPRSYRLPLRTIFRLGSLQLGYLDSTEIHRPALRVSPSDLSNQPYEPCIVAALIALAQKSSPPTDEPVIKTRLLFTHRDDDQDIHLYTARVSQRLLERFRHPNQPPTNDACSHTAPSLVKLQHTRIPFQPYDTFRNRVLAAVSVTTTVVRPKGDSNCLKRKYSDTDDGIDRKRRPPQGGLRKPLVNISLNRGAP